MSVSIQYSEGYKYQLEADEWFKTPVLGYRISDFYFELYPDGRLLVKRGYAWDGASGPTIDTISSMAPSLVHDVFCQLMRDRRVDYGKWQKTVNEFFRQQCVDCGMWPWRAAIWHAGVEFGDAGNPKQGPDRLVKEAPRSD